MRLFARFAGAAFALAGFMLVSPPTYAVDGVVLIDQAAVLAGIDAADGPGFPVTITEPGSYRLSSNLVLPAGSFAAGVSIETNDVSLDLNGFSIIGASTPYTDGIFIFGVNVEVRNGTVRDFGRHGVFARNAGKCFSCTDAEGVRILEVRAINNGLNGIRIESQGALVDGCSAHTNGSVGILAYQGALVKNSVARANVSYGFFGLSNTGFRSNVATANNGGDLNPQVSGGLNLGDNLCGTALCP